MNGNERNEKQCDMNDFIEQFKGQTRLKRYLSIALGIVLLLFSIGYLKIMTWIIALSGILLIVWGVGLPNVMSFFNRITEWVKSLFH